MGEMGEKPKKDWIRLIEKAVLPQYLPDFTVLETFSLWKRFIIDEEIETFI